MTCCDEHSRAELLRRGIARAGNGLPQSRPACRRRRARVSTDARSSRAASALPWRSTAARRSALASSTRASPQPRQRASSQRVLVSVFLDGGADALSLLAPVQDPLYRSLRPRLGLDPAAGTAFAEDPSLMWHPSLAPFAQLHGEGKVNVMPGIGYDHPNQSHFTSRHFWEVGAADERLVTGLARTVPRPGREGRQPAAGPVARLEPAALARHVEDAGGGRRRAGSLRLLGTRRLG